MLAAAERARGGKATRERERNRAGEVLANMFENGSSSDEEVGLELANIKFM